MQDNTRNVPGKVLYSPVISTGANPILKMVETISIPYNNFSFINHGNQLCVCMTITTHSYISDYSDRRMLRCMY